MAGARSASRRDGDNNAKLTAKLQCCQLRKAQDRISDRGCARRARVTSGRASTARLCCARADPLFIGRRRRAISAGALYGSRRYSRARELASSSGVKGNYILVSAVLRSSVRESDRRRNVAARNLWPRASAQADRSRSSLIASN